MPARIKRPRIRPQRRSARFLPARALRELSACLRRLPRESGITGDRWSAARIHRLLRKRFGLKLSPRYAIRHLRQAGMRVTLVRAREPRLSRSALARLRRTLRRPPSAAGLAGERWSRARIAELIERRFKRRFTPAHAGRLARRLRGRGLGPARDRRLTREQGCALHKVLRARTGPSRARPSWTRAQVAALIEQCFAVRYHPQSIPGLLRRWKISLVLAPSPQGDARPTPQQLATLRTALDGSPSAAGIAAPRWEQRHITQFMKAQFGLSYPTRGLYRRMNRWGLDVQIRASAGGTCALTTEQLCTLATALAEAPAHSGYSEAAWSRALVARLILDRFNVRYARGSIPYVLRRVGMQLRTPRRNTLAKSTQVDAMGTAILPPASSESHATPASLWRPMSNGETIVRSERSHDPMPHADGDGVRGTSARALHGPPTNREVPAARPPFQDKRPGCVKIVR